MLACGYNPFSFLASTRYLDKGKLKLIVVEGHSSRVVLGTAMTEEKTKKIPGSPQAWAVLKTQIIVNTDEINDKATSA